MIDIWDDTRLSAGDKWREEIAQAITNCKVAILLISADFLASEFIAQNELPPLLRAARLDGVPILPVVVGACRFTKTPEVSQFQVVNDPERPLAALPVAERERVWVRVADSVEAALANRNPSEGWAVANERTVTASLNQLVNSADGSFLIVSSGAYYVQFNVRGRSLNMEAVSNQFLVGKEQLSSEKEQQLIALGFRPPEEALPNYHRATSLDDAKRDAQAFAALAVNVMAGVYEVSQQSRLAVELTLEE
jgi:hypothetical protein